MVEEADLEQLNLLHPNLRPYVKVLITHEFGLLKDLPEIHNIQCGSIVKKNEVQCGDRFEIRILYCRKALNWHILMNGNDITKAPDFILEENFLATLTPNAIRNKLPSLVNWNPSDVKCLLNVVLELLELYKSYQVKLLQTNSTMLRYLFEYETLTSMAGMSPDDVEFCVQSAVRTILVTFLIHLNVDFSMLPNALPNSKSLIVLVVEFKDNTKSKIQLIPRVELEDAFGSPLDLPDLIPETTLMDYVPLVAQHLQNKIQKLSDYSHQRKMLYSYLVQFFEPSIVNGDNINFRDVSFLLELNGFFCVLNVTIPLDYPESRPVLHFFSLHKSVNQRVPEYSGFKHNQNMSHEEIARSIFNFVKEKAIAEFQKSVLC